MKRVCHIFILIFFGYSLALTAQPSNDNCSTRYVILDPIDWCSPRDQFTTVGASDAGFGPASCFNGNNNDVWFEFTAFATAAYIVINGSNGGNTLNRPQVALYSGLCSSTISQLSCATDQSQGGISLLENGLVIGTKYLIRVSGQTNSEGTFQLCINNYNPPAEPGQDCPTASILCDKSPFSVQVLSGGGSLPDEGDGTCLEGGNPNTLTEDQSTWFKWTAETSGTLTFTITPINATDDIDYALYELTNGITSCEKSKLRCVATSCNGPTGLNLTSVDLEEDYNCESNEDGFVKYIDMVAGKSYGLLINNFSNSGIGFNMEWGGTGEFSGPKPNFTIDPTSGLKCDQDFIITDKSTIPVGQSVSYNWTFGERALPLTSTTVGPHSINFESFGQKFIVLTLTSDRGCKVTNVLPLYADPCCEDLPPLTISISEQSNPSCPETADGELQFSASGGGGSDYMYAISPNGVQDENSFSELASGTYQVTLTDIKGCRDSIDVILLDPDPVIVNAGPDTTIFLGSTTTLHGSYNPFLDYNIKWTPTSGVSDSTILDPVVLPYGTTTYTLNVFSDSGCRYSDEVEIKVISIRDIVSPNVFSPNEDGTNDFFNIGGGNWIVGIDVLKVYDRWGNKIYEGLNLTPNDYSIGWDGTFNGQEVNAGVYVWVATVRYVDKIVLEKAGDVTIVK